MLISSQFWINFVLFVLIGPLGGNTAVGIAVDTGIAPILDGLGELFIGIGAAGGQNNPKNPQSCGGLATDTTV